MFRLAEDVKHLDIPVEIAGQHNVTVWRFAQIAAWSACVLSLPIDGRTAELRLGRPHRPRAGGVVGLLGLVGLGVVPVLGGGLLLLDGGEVLADPLQDLGRVGREDGAEDDGVVGWKRWRGTVSRFVKKNYQFSFCEMTNT